MSLRERSLLHRRTVAPISGSLVLPISGYAGVGGISRTGSDEQTEGCSLVAVRQHALRVVSSRSRGAGRIDIHAPGISSAWTTNLVSALGPNVVAIATSEASRPRAINTRPMRGTRLRASNVYQRLSRNASNQPAKSIGSGL